jgi:hypothetical protein
MTHLVKEGTHSAERMALKARNKTAERMAQRTKGNNDDAERKKRKIIKESFENF